MPLLPPPAPEALDPLVSTWGEGKTLVRVHHRDFAAASCNPGFGRGRFHPFAAAGGGAVATLYASDTVDGALSETVFRAVPLSGPARRITAASFAPLLLSRITPRRDLRLAALYGHGLGRLGLARRDLIDSEAAHYAQTVAWAAALHAAPLGLDGLEWVSRQHDSSRALMLFCDRLAPEDLEPTSAPEPLAAGRGWERVLEAAEAAGILVLT